MEAWNEVVIFPPVKGWALTKEGAQRFAANGKDGVHFLAICGPPGLTALLLWLWKPAARKMAEN